MSHKRFTVFLAFLAVLFTAGMANAQQHYTQTIPFQTSGQNMWGSGEAVDVSVRKWLGWETGWHSATAAYYWDIPAFGEFGGRLTGYLDWCKAGLIFDCSLHSGSVAVNYPVNAKITYPSNGVLYPGDTFAVSTAWSPGLSASLATTSPSQRLKLDAILDAKLVLHARAYAFGENVFEEDLFNYHLAINYGLLPFTEYLLQDDWEKNYKDQFWVKYHRPRVDTSGGLSADNRLYSAGSDTFLDLHGNITSGLTQLIGLPGTSGSNRWGFGDSYFWYGYDFARLNADLDFIAAQDFRFTPTPRLSLSASNDQAANLNLGESSTFTMPTVAPGATSNDLTFHPSFSLENSLRNRTRLVITPGLKFLPAYAGGGLHLDLWVWEGDVFDFSWQPWNEFDIIGDANLSIPLFEDSFTLGGFDTFPGGPFRVMGYVYPPPVVSSIDPIMVKKGSGATTLTAGGSDFVPAHGINPSSKVQRNGSERATTFVSDTKLTGQITGADTDVEGIHNITVLNPPPGGGGSIPPLPFIVDGTPPVTGIALDGPAGSNDWWKGTVKVDLSASDNLAGPDSTSYQVDGGAIQTQHHPFTPGTPPYSDPANTPTFEVAGDLIHTVTYNSLDNVANSEGAKSQIIMIDTTDPVTTITLPPLSGSNGWYNGPVEVNLSATDNLSGVGSTTYSVDGVETTYYHPNNPANTPPFTVTGDLKHTVTYNSRDNAGNGEGTESQIIKLDTTRPVLSAFANPNKLWPPNGKMVTVAVDGRITDNLSGVDLDSARFFVQDEYDKVKPSGPIALTVEGYYAFTTQLQAARKEEDKDGRTYTIIVEAKDIAGWANSTSTVVVVPHDQRQR